MLMSPVHVEQCYVSSYQQQLGMTQNMFSKHFLLAELEPVAPRPARCSNTPYS